MQRLKLKHHREFRGALGLVSYDVPGDFGGESEGEAHNLLDSSNRMGLTFRGGGVGKSRDKERRRGDRVRSLNSAATDCGGESNTGYQGAHYIPIQLHRGSMGCAYYGCNY